VQFNSSGRKRTYFGLHVNCQIFWFDSKENCIFSIDSHNGSNTEYNGNVASENFGYVGFCLVLRMLIYRA